MRGNKIVKIKLNFQRLQQELLIEALYNKRLSQLHKFVNIKTFCRLF